MLLISIAILPLAVFGGLAPAEICPSVPLLSSPANLINWHIESIYKSLKTSSKEDQFKLIFFAEDKSKNVLNYQLIFLTKLSSENVPNYIGLVALQPDSAIPAASPVFSISKFIRSEDINEVKSVIGVKGDVLTNGYPCADLKEQFEHFVKENPLNASSATFPQLKDIVNLNSSFETISTRNKDNLSPHHTSIIQNKEIPTDESGKKEITANVPLPANNDKGNMDEQREASQLVKGPKEILKPTDNQSAQAKITLAIQQRVSEVKPQAETFLNSTILNDKDQIYKPKSYKNPEKASANATSSSQTDTLLPGKVSNAPQQTFGKDSSQFQDFFPDLNYNYENFGDWLYKSPSKNSSSTKEKVTVPDQLLTSQTNVTSESTNSFEKKNQSEQNLTAQVWPENNKITSSQNRTQAIVNGESGIYSIKDAPSEFNYPNYEQSDIRGSQTQITKANNPERKNIEKDAPNTNISDLISKGMTPVQIWTFMRNQDKANEGKKKDETPKFNSVEQQNNLLLAQKLKNEQEMLQKLNLLLSYRKRQEQEKLTAKVRPTEYLYTNYYGGQNQIPPNSEQQGFQTTSLNSLVKNNPDLVPYLNLPVADLSRIIDQKENYISFLKGVSPDDKSSNKENAGTSETGTNSDIQYVDGLPASISHMQNRFFTNDSIESIIRRAINQANPDSAVSLSAFVNQQDWQ